MRDPLAECRRDPGRSEGGCAVAPGGLALCPLTSPGLFAHFPTFALYRVFHQLFLAQSLLPFKARWTYLPPPPLGSQSTPLPALHFSVCFAVTGNVAPGGGVTHSVPVQVSFPLGTWSSSSFLSPFYWPTLSAHPSTPLAFCLMNAPPPLFYSFFLHCRPWMLLSWD